jgi:predicted PurR-regulated permease PerM
MEIREHAQITGGALKRWFIAQLQDAACVALLWLVGLLIIGVPWAPLWAVLAALLQFIPHLGPVLSLVGPAIFAVASGGFMRLIYVFILYAVVAVVDGLVLQPYIMRRTARVPIWASILAPIVLGLIFNFWGVLLAAPLLAVFYAYRSRRRVVAPRYEIQPPGRWTDRTPPM